MIFWGLIALALLISVWYAWSQDYVRFRDTFVSFLWGVLCTAIVGAIVFGITGAISYGVVKYNSLTTGTTETENDLRALSNSYSVEGQFYFLGRGVINGSQQINFVRQMDGYSQLDAVDGSRARIFEDEADNPYMVTRSWYADMTWLAPWLTAEDYWLNEYDFHIPEGSVSDGDFVVDATK